MVLKKFWRKASQTTPTEDDSVTKLLEEHREAAQISNLSGDSQLEEMKSIRDTSKESHSKLKKIREENHLAELMLRAMQGAR